MKNKLPKSFKNATETARREWLKIERKKLVDREKWLNEIRIKLDKNDPFTPSDYERPDLDLLKAD